MSTAIKLFECHKPVYYYFLFELIISIVSSQFKIYLQSIYNTVANDYRIEMDRRLDSINL